MNMEQKILKRLAALLLATLPFAAEAQGPEQFYERGPEAGRWNVEYDGQVGRSGARPHSVETFFGVSSRLALGIELEAEREEGGMSFEEVGVGALLSLTGEGAPLETALLVQANLTTGGNLDQLEARLIAERSSKSWRALGNLILRRSSGEESGASLGYAAAFDRRVLGNLFLGLEASGQAARLAGFRDSFEPGHYAGPRLSSEWEVYGREVEVGVSYLRRLDEGEDYRDNLRLVVGMEF